MTAEDRTPRDKAREHIVKLKEHTANVKRLNAEIHEGGRPVPAEDPEHVALAALRGMGDVAPSKGQAAHVVVGALRDAGLLSFSGGRPGEGEVTEDFGPTALSYFSDPAPSDEEVEAVATTLMVVLRPPSGVTRARTRSAYITAAKRAIAALDAARGRSGGQGVELDKAEREWLIRLMEHERTPGRPGVAATLLTKLRSPGRERPG